MAVMNSRQRRALGEFVDSGALALMVGVLSSEWEFDVVEAARAGDAKGMRQCALRLVSLVDFRVLVADWERQGVLAPDAEPAAGEARGAERGELT